jgi:hypothetical protein
MLNHQLFMLPPYEQFWQDLPEVFEWLHNGRSKEVKDAILAAKKKTAKC